MSGKPQGINLTQDSTKQVKVILATAELADGRGGGKEN